MLTVANTQVLIAAALVEERGAVVPVLRGAIDELLDREREIAKSELVSARRGLELQVAKLAVSALELALNVERGRVLDVPKFPLKAVLVIAARMAQAKTTPMELLRATIARVSNPTHSPIFAREDTRAHGYPRRAQNIPAVLSKDPRGDLFKHAHTCCTPKLIEKQQQQ
jgi:hypothetical protein